MTELTDDLAAFMPQPKRSLRFQGRVYPVRAFLDLTVPEVLDLLQGEEGLAGKPLLLQLARARHQVEVLVPTMDAATRRRLTTRQALQVAGAAREASRAVDGEQAEVRLGFWFAQAARFYGWTWETIEKRTLRQLHRFLDLIPELQARERLEESLVAAFPYLEKGPRQTLRQHWLLTAKLVSQQDLERMKGEEHERAWAKLGLLVRRGKRR